MNSAHPHRPDPALSAAACDEPLHDSAPLAHALAAMHCSRDPDHGCAWYHGYWQYFRLLGAMSSASDHSQAWAEALTPLIHESGLQRMLLSGSADFALLSCAVDACRKTGIEADVTVLDICETPLALSRWYGQERKLRLHTAQADILTYAAGQPFDLIVAHAFLGNFSPEARSQAIKNWHRLLRPGGKICIMQRIRPDCAVDVLGFTPSQAASLFAHIDNGVESLGLIPEVTSGIRHAARVYAERFTVHTIRSLDELLTTFREAGFRIDDCVPVRKDAGKAVAFSGPSVNEEAMHHRIIATRL